MKSFCRMLLCLFVCTTCFASPPKTKEEFLAAVRAAFEAKDVQALSALTWWNGTSEKDRKMSEDCDAMLLKEAQPGAIATLEPLFPFHRNIIISLGRRIEPTYPPVGMVKVNYKTDKVGNIEGPSIPYAVIDGAYYIVTSKITDLGWKGPLDKHFYVSVSGKGFDKVKVRIRYNASGVDMEDDETGFGPYGVASEGGKSWTTSVGKPYRCQYISEVTVTSKDDDVDVTLNLDGMEKFITPFYKSEPLKGKGQIVYKKGDVSAPSK